MSEQLQPGEDGAMRLRLAFWQAMQLVLTEPLLQQMFDNVLREALKHYPAEQLKQELRSVGISDEQIERVFQRHQHVYPSEDLHPSDDLYLSE